MAIAGRKAPKVRDYGPQTEHVQRALSSMEFMSEQDIDDARDFTDELTRYQGLPRTKTRAEMKNPPPPVPNSAWQARLWADEEVMNATARRARRLKNVNTAWTGVNNHHNKFHLLPGRWNFEHISQGICALAIRDLIGEGDYTQAVYDNLTSVWRAYLGPLHPDDPDWDFSVSQRRLLRTMVEADPDGAFGSLVESVAEVTKPKK